MLLPHRNFSSGIQLVFTSHNLTSLRVNPDDKEPQIEEMSINEIINGGNRFPGLAPLIHRFLQDTATEIETSCHIRVIPRYLKVFILIDYLGVSRSYNPAFEFEFDDLGWMDS